MFKKQTADKDRFLILGRSESMTVIAEELARSSAVQRSEIVLASRFDPGESVKSHFPVPPAYIQGNPAETAFLETLKPASARRILVNLTGAPDGDLQALRIATALQTVLASAKDGPDILILVDSPEYRAKIQTLVVPKMKVFCPIEAFPAIAAQSCRQDRLSLIFDELFSYHGNEIYRIPGKPMKGLSWTQVLRAFANACPVGLAQNGKLSINPKQSVVIEEDDELYVLAGNPDDIQIAQPILPAPDNRDISPDSIETTHPQNFLFLGWNPLCPSILADLAHYAPKGSAVRIVCRDNPGFNQSESPKISIQWTEGDPRDKAVIAAADLENWENIVIPGSAFPASSEQMEILHTLAGLMAGPGLRNHITTLTGTPAPEYYPKDRILSTDILYKLAVQLLIQPDLFDVFRELIQPIGTEIYLKPAENYVTIDRPVDFYTILESARRKNETAIGYFLEENRKIALNPVKTEKIGFYHYDKIIVLSDEH